MEFRKARAGVEGQGRLSFPPERRSCRATMLPTLGRVSWELGSLGAWELNPGRCCILLCNMNATVVPRDSTAYLIKSDRFECQFACANQGRGRRRSSKRTNGIHLRSAVSWSKLHTREMLSSASISRKLQGIPKEIPPRCLVGSLQVILLYTSAEGRVFTPVRQTIRS